MVEVDLGSWEGQVVRIRFRWGADDSNEGTFTGWTVDDVRITVLWPPSQARVYLPLIARMAP
jgi:hypothetical protein